MSDLVYCPGCQRQLKVPETAARKTIRCPACKTDIPPASAARTAIEPEVLEAESDSSLAVTAAPARPTASTAAPVRPSQEEEPEEVAGMRVEKSSRKRSSPRLILGLVAGAVVLLLAAVGTGAGLLWFLLGGKTIPLSEWQPFSPPGGECTVLLPGTPQLSQLTVNGVTLNKYTVERKRENAFFSVAYADLDILVLQPSLRDTIVSAERDNLLRIKPGSQVVSESTLTLNGVLGRELQIKPPHRGTLIERMYFAQVGTAHRLYIVVAGGDSIQPNQGDAALFFDSFQITALPPPMAGGGGIVIPIPQPPAANPAPPVRPVTQPQRPKQTPKQ